MFVIDVMKEHIAVKEAIRLNIPVFGIVDTNSDPSPIDFVIPANDDATKSIELITDVMVKAIQEGLSERKVEKDSEGSKEKRTRSKKADPAKAKAKKEEVAKEAPAKETPAKETPAQDAPEATKE
jgi:small subunit ribosomal protein S2